jgi:hypothetical protein
LTDCSPIWPRGYGKICRSEEEILPHHKGIS